MFNSGTSPSRLKRENNRKGRRKTRIELRFIGVMSSIPQRGTNRKNTMKGIIGKKIGMTSIFGADGKQTAVTIIEAGPCVVTQVKTQDTDGYNAIQLGFGDKTEKHSIKAEINHFAKANTPAKKFVKEFRDSSLNKNIGETVTVDIFAEGDKVEVVGTTKGKGFQGVVKRHGFHGVGEQSHGQHDRQPRAGFYRWFFLSFTCI